LEQLGPEKVRVMAKNTETTARGPYRTGIRRREQIVQELSRSDGPVVAD
jgi:hypothetical protein